MTELTQENNTPISVKVAANTFKFKLNKKLSASDISVSLIEKTQSAVTFEITLDSIFFNSEDWSVTPMLENIIQEVFEDTRKSKTNTRLEWVDDRSFKIKLVE